MPGIAGIISKIGVKRNQENLQGMINCMIYEAFYNSGTYSNSKLGIYAGWVCHKDSFSDCMPIFNERKDLILFFSGENFVDKQVTDRLKIQGHEFDDYNASYLIHFYEEEEDRFLQDLNGWFSGILVDLREGKIVLFNDRYGMHRIHYYEDKDAFYFSSEAKAILSILPESREFDPNGLGEFLTCGCTLGNRSLFKNVGVLPSGSFWTFVDGKIKTRRSYFDHERWIGQQLLDRKKFLPHFTEFFGSLVRRYTKSRLSVGISLTGGLDSRMIMACLDTIDGKFPCYTFGSMYRDTFDVKVAREVTKACSQSHHILVLGKEFLQKFSSYLEKAVYISDGYIGMSGAAELYINELAREIAMIRLTGNYGGELLRGVRAFKSELPRNGFVTPELHPFLRKAHTTFQLLDTKDAVTFALFHQAPSQGYGRLSIERSQLVLRTPFMDNELVKLTYQSPPQLLKTAEISVAILSEYNPKLLKIPTDRGLLCNGPWISRLYRRLQSEALFKGEYWMDHGMFAWMAAISRYELGRFLEKRLIGCHKFQHFRLWTQKPLAKYVTEILLHGCRNLQEFLNLCKVKRMLYEHMTCRRNYTHEIDKLLTLILAYEILFKGRTYNRDTLCNSQSYFSNEAP